MRNIAFHIQRGGSGKTTLTGNVGYLLSERMPVVLVDCDAQGSLSAWLVPHRQKYELADVLYGRVSAAQAIVPVTESLHVLGSFGIDGELKKFAESDLYRQPFAIRGVREQLVGGGYAAAIWDLAPGMSTLERMVLAEVEEVVSPVQLEDFSLDGIEIFTAELDKIRRDYRATLRHERIVANGYNRSIGRHLAYLEQFRSLNGYHLYVTFQDQAIPEAQAAHVPILEAERTLKEENLTELLRLAGDLIG